MGPGVVAHLVPGEPVVYQPPMAFDLLPDHEEGAGHTGGLQRVQEHRGPLRGGTVVEGQRDDPIRRVDVVVDGDARAC